MMLKEAAVKKDLMNNPLCKKFYNSLQKYPKVYVFLPLPLLPLYSESSSVSPQSYLKHAFQTNLVKHSK